MTDANRETLSVHDVLAIAQSEGGQFECVHSGQPVTAEKTSTGAAYYLTHDVQEGDRPMLQEHFYRDFKGIYFYLVGEPGYAEAAIAGGVEMTLEEMQTWADELEQKAAALRDEAEKLSEISVKAENKAAKSPENDDLKAADAEARANATAATEAAEAATGEAEAAEAALSKAIENAEE